ncbi:MAG TPA: glycoside hydrolase family 16 protein [Gemmatimonadaceae bacterium]|nr:glycoside hydrolase family 16 protein [Gemmatimonadaceae bacterium]
MSPPARIGLAVLLVACAACTDSAPTTAGNARPTESALPTEWTQIWSDEFDGPAGAAVDSSKWTNDLGDGCSNGNCGWGNNELESYSDDRSNISLNGQGQLAIVGKPVPPVLKCYYGPCRYTSAKITTRGKFTVSATGRVEARIKLPEGQGLWPAFWLLGTTCQQVGWPDCGEIDIMESKGSLPTLSSSALHGPGYSGQTPFANWQRFSSGSITDFHTYAVEWNPRSVQWFVDGMPHYQVGATDIHVFGKSVLGKSFFVILNLAIGGHFDGNPRSESIFPATMLVDYVRVFRPKSQ